jgi:diguanylate cyclase (GGDEF)-like protein/PAS domain S-box-containing protein
VNTRAQRFGWMPIALGVLALVLFLSASDRFSWFDNAASDARARLLQHAVETDIVIVGIDAPSLADLQRWPWPRRYHARLLEQLADAGAGQVFLDIDFSAHTTAEDDAALAAALRRFQRPQVVLPAFLQRGLGSNELLLSRPREGFLEHVRLASVNLQPGADNLVRDIPSNIAIEQGMLPSLVSAVVASRSAMPNELPIDFSIAPESFQYMSYVDVLAGRIDPAELRGKTVFVGATAVELNDMLPVPVHRSLPGVVILALATETARAEAVTRIPPAAQVSLLAVLASLAAFVFGRNTWRANALILTAALGALGALYIGAFDAYRLVFPIAPVVTTIVATFLVTTLRALDEQTWRALTFSLGLRRRDALLRSVVDSSADCILCIDAEGAIQTANAAAARLFACPPHELLHAHLRTFIPALSDHDAVMSLAGAVTEHQAVRADASRMPVEISVSPVNAGNELLHTVIVRDCSERKAQEEQLRHQALHDSLTGLPNRPALMAHLAKHLERATQGESVAVLMLDLCRFKEVNDTLGHGIGDQVLTQVARRFEAAAPDAFVSRVGGDEFTVVLDRVRDRADVAKVARQVSDCMLTPIVAADIATDIGVSIGIASYPDEAHDAAMLLRHADVAMYESKRLGSAFEFYDAARDQHTVRRLAMVSELRTAIAAGELALHYQPQIDLRSGRCAAVEALLRWFHPEHGVVSPGEFIPIAESTDLIHSLTEWSIAEALGQARRWKAVGFMPRIAVNLSARVLQDTSFPQKLHAMLAASGADPSQLELEITESAMMLDAARALRVVRELHALGVVLSIDDFGTGFSSLGYLRDLPVHALKLDRSFVTHIQQRTEDRVIVDSTVQMAHALKLEVIAEGVENKWTADYLRMAGFDFAQGYFFTRALSADDCARWVLAFNAAVPAVSSDDEAYPALKAG